MFSLWAKELDAAAAYVDILRNTASSVTIDRSSLEKDNDKALRLRTEGNKKFNNADIGDALDLYNQSLRFAEKGSPHIPLAYANRSSCYLRMKLYEECLADIELAVKANYPEHLSKKLEDRKRECLEQIADVKPSPAPRPQEELCSPAHENFPAMSDVLHLETSEQYGRMVVATRDIAIGETVLIEKAVLQLVYGFDGGRCAYCAKENGNLVPCDNCTHAMFCNDECASNQFHADVCGISFGDQDFLNGESLTFILRSVAIAINAFDSVAELMDAVENYLKGDPHDIPHSLVTAQEKYAAFFTLSKSTAPDRVANVREPAHVIFTAMMEGNVGKKFETLASQRFLMHLIIHHALVLRANEFSGLSPTKNGYFGYAPVGSQYKQYEKVINVMASYFNHSCVPNAARMVRDDVTYVKTLLPVEAGEQLFVSYSYGVIPELPELSRNNHLEDAYGFRCVCRYCLTGNHQIHHLCRDPDFLAIINHLPTLLMGRDRSLLQSVKAHCIEFLLRHHPKSIASSEASFVLHNFRALMEKELNGC